MENRKQSKDRKSPSKLPLLEKNATSRISKTNAPSTRKRLLKRKFPGLDGHIERKIGRLVLNRWFAKGAHLIFVGDQFWSYGGGVWGPVNDRQIEAKVLEVLKGIKVANNHVRLMKEVSEILKTTTAVVGDPFRPPAYDYPVINCRNGEVHLLANRTVELRAHRPESFLNHQLDVVYDPTAKCPKYSKAVLDIFSGSGEMRTYWHEVSGYAVQSLRWLAVIFVLFGGGSNGKTALIKTLVRLIGSPLVYASRVDALERDPRAIAHFDGKQLFVDDDVARDAVLPDGILKKKISEEKILTGERKYENKREIECRVATFLLCNNIPELRDMSYGALRRLQVIPFDARFVEPNEDAGLFPMIWRTEIAGVLNRMIAGYQRLQARGRFKIPGPVKAATDKWLTQASLLRRFIENCCFVDASAKAWGKDLHIALKVFAQEEGVRVVPERNRFYVDLSHQGFEQKKGRNGQRFSGIRLK
jgi:putative DNA primase/helicase